MTAGSAFWDFQGTLAPVVSGGIAGSIAARGTSTIGLGSGGTAFYFYPKNSSSDDTPATRANGFTITVGPPAGTSWQPGQITFASRTGSGYQYLSMAVGSRDRLLWNYEGPNYVNITVDLSGLGTVDGPIDLNFWGSSTNYVYLDNLSVTGEVLAGAADQTLTPGSVDSAEAFGVPAVVVLQPVDLTPASIISGEAFGVPVIFVVPPVDLTPASIISGEAFGVPAVVVAPPPVDVVGVGGIVTSEAFGLPTISYAVAGSVPYPAGVDVAAFLGTADPKVVAVAEIHVGVVTQFAAVYTRGNGFYVAGLAEPIASVILAATARLVGNPEQLDITVGSVRRASYFKGWSLAEQRVLNSYRKVAA